MNMKKHPDVNNEQVKKVDGVEVESPLSIDIVKQRLRGAATEAFSRDPKSDVMNEEEKKQLLEMADRREEAEKLLEGKTSAELVQAMISLSGAEQLNKQRNWAGAFANHGARAQRLKERFGSGDLGPFSIDLPSVKRGPVFCGLPPLSTEVKEDTEQVRMLADLEGAQANLWLWYNNWNTHRDYSSSVNLAMSLGKLSATCACFIEFGKDKNNELLNAKLEELEKQGEQMWEELKSIRPF